MKVTINVQNVKSQIVGQLDPNVLAAMRSKLSAEMVGAFFARQRNPYAGTKYFFTPKTQMFPTGMIHYVRDVLDKFNVEWEIMDYRPEVVLGKPLPIHDVTLREYQEEAVGLAIQRERGILCAGTGAGKSSMLSAIIARTNVKTLILIHKQDIFYQLISTFERILKIPIGKLGDGECQFENVTVAMIQTVAHIFDPKVKVLAKDNKILAEKADVIKQFLGEIECVLIDEAHHVAADTFWDVMQNIPKARYRIGVTATPFREDNMDLMLEGALAKQFIKISSSDLIDKKFLVPPDIYLFPVAHQRRQKDDTYGIVYNEEIVNNMDRNSLICNLALKARHAGKSVLIAVTQIEHGEVLEHMLQTQDKTAIFVNGQSKSEVRKNILKQLGSGIGPARIVVATNIYSEGVDMPALAVLINAAGAASGIHSLQLLGRVLRSFPGKTKAWVVDLQDNGKFLNNHSKERVNIYTTEPRYKLIPVQSASQIDFTK
jgi:superfamily II DNA or RNA helicase